MLGFRIESRVKPSSPAHCRTSAKCCAARENFCDRLARFSKQSCAMLAGDERAVPPKSNVPGRGVAVKHARVH
jgi:hypothetical protein